MEFLLLLLHIPVLIFLIKWMRKQHSDPLLVKSYYYLLSLKVTAGLCIGILYFGYYKGGDTFAYNEILRALQSVFFNDFNKYCRMIFYNEIPAELYDTYFIEKIPRVMFFIRLLSPFYILSGGNYWMLSIYLSIFSFWGIWKLSDSLVKIFKLRSLAVMISFFLLPSFVFWTSGLLKESLVMGVMCSLLSIVFDVLKDKKKITFLSALWILVALWILLKVKFYFLVTLMTVLIPYCMVTIVSERWFSISAHKGFRIALFLCLIIFFGILGTNMDASLHMDEITNSLYYSYEGILNVSDKRSVYTFEGLNPSAKSFFPHIPRALVYGLFGPFLWHCKNLISLFAGIENTFLLILFATFILTNFNKKGFGKIDIEEIGILLYVCVFAIFVAFSSPNWGSLVRYKIGYLPFFVLFILNNNPLILQLEERFKIISDRK